MISLFTKGGKILEEVLKTYKDGEFLKISEDELKTTPDSFQNNG